MLIFQKKKGEYFLKKEKIYQFLMDYEENLSFCLELPKALIVTTTPIVLIILYLTGTGKLFFCGINFISASYSYAVSDIHFEITDSKKIS